MIGILGLLMRKFDKVNVEGRKHIDFFPQQRRLDVLGGEGCRSRRFQIETLYRRKGLIKKSQPVKSERCLC